LKSGKKLMLIYNIKNEEIAGYPELGFSTFKDVTILKNVPTDWLITTDRRYLRQADMVVFYLPDLFQEMENDLEKPDGQIWVAWYLKETDKEYPWVNDPENREIFDFWLYYPEDELQKGRLLSELCRSILGGHTGSSLQNGLGDRKGTPLQNYI